MLIQVKINLKIVSAIKSYRTKYLTFIVKFRNARGRSFFLCPLGQKVGSSPNVHESTQ